MQRLTFSLPIGPTIAIPLSGGVFAIALQHLLEGGAFPHEALRIPLLGGVMALALGLVTLMARVAPARAFISALGLGAVTGLLLWTSGAGNPLAFFQRDVSAGAMVAFCVLTTLPLPILQSLGLGSGLRYAPIFQASLQILLMWGTGVIFALLAWGTILIAGALLELVGLSLVEDLLNIDHVPAALTGVLFGLGCATFAALPFGDGRVPMMLTRLLAPPFMLVQLLFLLALPLHGVSGLDVSPTLLMGWSVLFAALLVSVISGPDGQARTLGRFWQMTAIGLTVLMVPMAAVALWSVGLRLQTHGLTPSRIAGVSLAGFATLIALGYALSLRRRRVSVGPTNMVGAAVLLGLVGMLLSGLISPEALSVRSQMARLERGDITLSEMPLREMAGAWGPAGQSALQDLRKAYGDDPKTLAQIDRLASGSFLSTDPAPEGEQPDTAKLRTRLGATLPLLPAEGLSPSAFVDSLDITPEALQSLLTACAKTTPEGHAGCLAVAGDFLTDHPGPEVILLSSQAEAPASGWQMDTKGTWRQVPLGGAISQFGVAQAIDALHRTGPVLKPAPLQVLSLKDQDLIFSPNR